MFVDAFVGFGMCASGCGYIWFLMLLLLDFALFVLREVFDIITLHYIGWFMFALTVWWVWFDLLLLGFYCFGCDWVCWLLFVA